MMVNASKHPPGLQHPHVTIRIRLPSKGGCHFPLKEKYGRQFRSVGGIAEVQTEKQKYSNVASHFVCPDEHVELEIADTTGLVAPVSDGGPSSSGGPSSGSRITPPQLE